MTFGNNSGFGNANITNNFEALRLFKVLRLSQNCLRLEALIP